MSKDAMNSKSSANELAPLNQWLALISLIQKKEKSACSA